MSTDTPVTGTQDGETWIDVMRKYKPDITDDEAENILWNETCYPFSNEIALEQIKTYFTQTYSQL